MVEQIDKLGLASTEPLTPVSVIISDLAHAINGELEAKLFKVSLVVLLFVQIFGKPKTIADRKFLWAAVLLVALIDTANYLLVVHSNNLLVSDVFKTFGLHLRVDPSWLGAAQTSVRIITTGFALGLLYIHYGIESSILASFGSSVMAHMLLSFRFAHFM